MQMQMTTSRAHIASHRLCFMAIAIAVLSMSSAIDAQLADSPAYWNQFRGHHADGGTRATGLPLTWSESENVTWKTAIHGKGWSSPVVWDKRIWLTTATEDGKQLSILSIDADTGKILFDRMVFPVERPNFCHPTNSYASPTPVVEEGRLYVHFGAYGTACIDTNSASTLWERRDFVCDDFRGPGSSPIVDDERLYVNFDGVDKQYVVALDKQTGKTVWKQDRRIDYGTDNPDRKKAYGTPLLINHAGRPQLVSPSAAATIAYDPATGKELWRIQHGGMNAAARPLYRDGLLYVAAGDGDLSLLAMRPDGEGLLSKNRVAWSTGKSVPKRPSQILIGEMLWMIDDNGVASCLDAASGEAIWRARVDGDYWASPIAGDGRIYFCSKKGKCVVVATDRQFKVLAENQLKDGIVASPAVVENDLLIRTATHLYRIGS